MPTPPRGLLLDYGGVIVESERSPAAAPDVVAAIQDLIGSAVTPDLIEADPSDPRAVPDAELESMVDVHRMLANAV